MSGIFSDDTFVTFLVESQSQGPVGINQEESGFS